MFSDPGTGHSGPKAGAELGMKSARWEELGGSSCSGALLECAKIPFRAGHCASSYTFCLLLLKSLIIQLEISQKVPQALGEWMDMQILLLVFWLLHKAASSQDRSGHLRTRVARDRRALTSSRKLGLGSKCELWLQLFWESGLP